MANLQFSVSGRNDRLQALIDAVGASGVLKIFGGAEPANVGAADAGTALATITLPATWASTPAAGAFALAGTWEDTSADNSGTASHFRIYQSNGTTCHIQGDITVTGGDGTMKVANLTVTAGQNVEVTAFAITDGNA